jgi:hypothetical protein
VFFKKNSDINLNDGTISDLVLLQCRKIECVVWSRETRQATGLQQMGLMQFLDGNTKGNSRLLLALNRVSVMIGNIRKLRERL